MWKIKVWKDVRDDPSIVLFEHPIHNCKIFKEDFFVEFGPVLEMLNGETMSDYIDFFFDRDVVSRDVLVFCGENEKSDFYDWAVECECIAPLKELHEGESKEEKDLRILKENENKMLELESINRKKELDSKAQEIQRLKKQIKKEREELDEMIDKELKTLYNIKNNLEKMITNPKVKPQKLEKTKNHFIREYIYYKEKHNGKVINEFELYL